MPLPNNKTVTTNYILSLPEGQRAELLDGVIYDMAPSSTIHQRIAGKLFNSISNYIEKRHGSCEAFIAPFAVFLTNDDENYVEPDISVICKPEKLTEKGCNGAPDWIIEIVSPSSTRMDYFIKLFKYRTAHVHEYWIVDPKDKTITVYDFQHDDASKYTFQDTVTVGVFSDLKINFKQILD